MFRNLVGACDKTLRSFTPQARFNPAGRRQSRSLRVHLGTVNLADQATNRGAVALIAPSAAYRIDDYAESARRLGVELAVATEAHHSLAEEMGTSLIPIDFDDPAEAAARIAAARPALKAIAALDDRGVEIAAAAAELRGLPHNPARAVRAARDKAEMRRRLAGVIPSPAYRTLPPDEDLADAAQNAVREVGAPAVIKPAALTGSAGVIRVDRPEEAGAAAERIRAIAVRHGQPECEILVEEFAPGAEVAVEGLVAGGEWETLAVFDKPDPLDGPFFPETHYVTPSRHPPPLIKEAQEVSARAAGALGIVQGPVHAELRLGERAVLLELAARPIGGLCGRALRFGLADTPLEDLIIRNALGERVRGTRLAPGASGVTMIPVPRRGVFAGIDGVAAARRVTHVTDVEVTRITGREVKPLPEESVYLGFVFARAETPDQVEAALRNAGRRLRVKIE